MKVTIEDLIRREGREPGGAGAFNVQRAIMMIRQLPPPEAVSILRNINPVALRAIEKRAGFNVHSFGLIEAAKHVSKVKPCI